MQNYCEFIVADDRKSQGSSLAFGVNGFKICYFLGEKEFFVEMNYAIRTFD